MAVPVPGPTPDASETHRGLVNTRDQVFSGKKTFLDPPRIPHRATEDLPVGGVELEGNIAFDSTKKRLQVHTGEQWLSAVMAVSDTNPTSLEEHLNSTEAHDATEITYAGEVAQLNVKAAIDELATTRVRINLLAGEGGAALVGYDEGGTWADGTTNPATTVENQLDKIVADLSGTAGAARVGATASGGLSSDNVQGQINELSDLINDNITPINVPLQGAIVHEDEPEGSLTYAKYSGGWVQVYGTVVNDGAFLLDGVIGSLPMGYRPNKMITQTTIAEDTTEVDAPNEVILAYIHPDGDIWVRGAPPASRVYLNFPLYRAE